MKSGGALGCGIQSVKQHARVRRYGGRWKCWWSDGSWSAWAAGRPPVSAVSFAYVTHVALPAVHDTLLAMPVAYTT